MTEEPPAEPVDCLRRAMEATGTIAAGVRPEQWSAPTPCPAWTVRALLDHVTAGNEGAAAAFGAKAGNGAGGAPADPVAAYRSSCERLLAVYRHPGALEQIVTLPFGSVPGEVAAHLRATELLVHGWDLARATGQPADLPRDVAETEIAFSRPRLAELPPARRPFEPPQPVDDAAPAIDRLAALLGRRVGPER